MMQPSRQRRLPPLLSIFLYLLALLTLAAGVVARLRLPAIGGRLGQQYAAAVQDLGLLGEIMPVLGGLPLQIATVTGTACLVLALLFSLWLFACGRWVASWANMAWRVERLEQLTDATAARLKTLQQLGAEGGEQRTKMSS